ncbi:histidinol-phosphatase, partial [Aquipuribacter hungaricus]
HHMHTQYSGGSDAPYLIEQHALHANRFGLDWIVVTDHGGPLHQKFGVNATYRDIALARQKHTDMLIFQGLEWNPPAGDHSTVFVPPGTNDLAIMSEFELLYDASINGNGASTPANEARAREAVRWLGDQVRAGRTDSALQIFHHPSRGGRYAPSEFRGMRDTEPTVSIGMEGAPGHQAAGIPVSQGGAGEGRGFYDGGPGTNSYPGYPLDSYRTYGGFDWLTSTVGGVWDSMLAEGKPWFVTATSDSHQVYRDSWTYGGAPTPDGVYKDPVFTRDEVPGRGDFWPGQYSQTVLGLRDFSYGSVVEALRSGRSYLVHGNLIDGLRLTVSTGGRRGVGTIGDTVQAARGGRVEVTVSVDLRRTPNFNEDIPQLARVDLIAGPITGPVADQDTMTAPGTRVVQSWEVSARQRDAGVAEFTYRFNRDESPLYLRVRGTDGNRASGGPSGLEPEQDVIGDADPWTDLWFYSNPVFITR